MVHYSSIPDLTAFAALVFVFWSMLRHHARRQVNSWLLAWTFVLLHFAAHLLNLGEGFWGTILATISLLALELAGIAFVHAASRLDLVREQPIGVLAWVAALLTYSTLVVWDVEAALPYYIAVAVLAVSLCAVHFRVRAKRTLRDNIFSFSSCLLLALLLGVLVSQGQMGYGIDATLSWLYLVAGIRYWQRYEDKSIGVLTAVFGFVVASLIFPIGIILRETYAPHLMIDHAIRDLPKFIIAIGILLTFLEEEIGRTEHLALHDALTGLPNRRLLEDRLANMLERAERNHTRAAILVVDLDGFKRINDAHGHAAGDEFLREAALRLGKVVRRADTLARSGGDEFTVLVSDILQPNGAKILAQKLQMELDRPIAVRQLELCVSASIGVAVYPEDGVTAESLCARADADMYRAKRQSKSSTESLAKESPAIILPSQ
ncbi:MAG TPA: GGDEF domain-containing protein [Acidobacteriaceae bacterium]|nr:GGDEF domain-containing protein [Acidobacteriaceae bacterium]